MSALIVTSVIVSGVTMFLFSVYAIRLLSGDIYGLERMIYRLLHRLDLPKSRLNRRSSAMRTRIILKAKCSWISKETALAKSILQYKCEMPSPRKTPIIANWSNETGRSTSDLSSEGEYIPSPLGVSGSQPTLGRYQPQEPLCSSGKPIVCPDNAPLQSNGQEP